MPCSFSTPNFNGTQDIINGNRLSVTRGAVTDSGAYDLQDRLITYGQNNYSYTKSGYLQHKHSATDSTSYTYDVNGNLMSARLGDGILIEYIIDAANRRVGKKVNGVTVQRLIYSDDLKPVAELDSAGQIISRFVYATHENVPEYMVRSGETYRFILDHLGSVRLVLNVTTGDIVQRLDYDECGNVLLNTDPDFQPFGFAGGIYDSQTKLVRFGARDYDASVGRWISKDPAGFAGMDGNHYGYVQQDPINVTDPTGLFAYSSTLSNQQANQIAQKQAAEGQSRFSRAMQSLRNLIGKPFRTKPNFGGYQQPYNQLGQFLTYSANPGLLASPITFFTIGFVQGTAAGYTGSTAPTPINLAQYWGIQLGLLFGTTMSCLGW